MCDYIKLSFEGTAVQSIFRGPFTMERLVTKAALVLKISEPEIQASFQAVYENH